MSIHVPGDSPNLQTLHLTRMDHSVAALTPAIVAFIPHLTLLDITRTNPEVAALLWRDTLVDAAISREWLAGVGRRTAHQRIAHLICEVHCKMRSVGLAEAESLQLPVTQVEIADALGLSSVHVNRVMQDLRREGLLDYRGRVVAIGNWARLQARGDFHPDYLHLRADNAA